MFCCFATLCIVYFADHCHVTSTRFRVIIWVHYNKNEFTNTYRVGQVVDLQDCVDILGGILIHRADVPFTFQPVLPYNQLPVLTAQGSQQIQAMLVANGLPWNYTGNIPPSTVAPLPITQSAQAPAPTSAPAPAPASTQLARVSSRTVPKIPKPRNSWIIYRQSKHGLVARENPEMHTSQICK